MILQIPGRIPIVGGIAQAVNAVIKLFQGSYKCEGPVAIWVSRLSKQNLEDMPYNQPECKTESYSYQTQRGCVNVDPFSTKSTTYRVKHCVEKKEGKSTAAGGVPLTSGGANQHMRSSSVIYVLFVGAIVLLVTVC